MYICAVCVYARPTLIHTHSPAGGGGGGMGKVTEALVPLGPRFDTAYTYSMTQFTHRLANIVRKQ